MIDKIDGLIFRVFIFSTRDRCYIVASESWDSILKISLVFSFSIRPFPLFLPSFVQFASKGPFPVKNISALFFSLFSIKSTFLTI